MGQKSDFKLTSVRVSFLVQHIKKKIEKERKKEETQKMIRKKCKMFLISKTSFHFNNKC